MYGFMQKWHYHIGVDVSRNTLDIYCSQVKEHIQINNGTDGFKAFIKWCKSYGIDLKRAIIAMEYTGGYEYKLIQFCERKSIIYVRIPGLAIKNSLGITRGKNDRVDALRIAQYAEEKEKSIEPSKPLNKVIIRLKELLSFRKRIVRETSGYKATKKERKHMYPDLESDFIIQSIESKIKQNDALLEAIDSELEVLISKNPDMSNNYALLTSIKGIGMVNALMVIAYTENFESFENARSYAVYAGVIPFDYSSGKSLKGRKRISPIANKEIKQELTQAAKSAMVWDKELREYAQRKLERKHYYKVVNNVRFKLILRMFSVVKRQEKYVENYKKAA
jgi:transposase